MPSKASGIINKVLKIFFGCTAFLVVGIIIALVVIVAAIFKITGNLPGGLGPSGVPYSGPTGPVTPGTTICLKELEGHKLPAESGKISYFGSEESGRPGAFGDVLDTNTMHYAAMRWPVSEKAWWKNRLILIKFSGKEVAVPIKDWGPAEWTGRVIDVSKLTMDALGAKTDDVVEICFAGQEPPTVAGPCAQRIVEIARSQVGTLEGRNNCNPYSPRGRCQAWCADFVSWVIQKAGTDFPWNSSAGGMKNYFQRYQILFGPGQGTPQPGDVFFVTRGGGSGFHVGIVESYSNGIVHTIEGNVGNPDGVWRLNRRIGSIYAFGRLKNCSQE